MKNDRELEREWMENEAARAALAPGDKEGLKRVKARAKEIGGEWNALYKRKMAGEITYRPPIDAMLGIIESSAPFAALSVRSVRASAMKEWIWVRVQLASPYPKRKLIAFGEAVANEAELNPEIKLRPLADHVECEDGEYVIAKRFTVTANEYDESAIDWELNAWPWDGPGKPYKVRTKPNPEPERDDWRVAGLEWRDVIE